MASPLRVGIVGVGALGGQHVRLYAELAQTGSITLAGLHDSDASRAQELARRYRIPAMRTLEELAAASDALSVVTPTLTHFELAKRLLELGKHVLIEKPMTQTSAQAAELVTLGRSRNAVLQVGHVERFNPVFRYLQTIAARPRFIEVHRLSPFPKRSTDIGVVLDLMIHDLDIVLAFVPSPAVSVEGVGVSVLSDSEDIANARIRFANGCIANLTASRVSPDRLRKIRVFSDGESSSYVSLDYRKQEGYICRLARQDERKSSLLRRLWAACRNQTTVVGEFAGRTIVREPVPIRKSQPLKLELESFIECVQARGRPVVSGESGKRALDLAVEITEQVQKNIAPAGDSG